MAFVPHKSPMLGFAIQTSLGQVITSPTMVFPLRDGTDFKPKRSKEFYQNNAGNFERTHYFTSSLVTEGTINIPFVPGMLAHGVETGLHRWLFARDVDPFQGYYATIFEFLGNSSTWAFPDVKCTGGGFKIEDGKTVDLSIKAFGGGAPVSDGVTFPGYDTAKWFDGRKPYTFDEVRVSLNASGATPATDEYTMSHTPEWDNMVLQTPSLVYGRLGPKYLPNTARAQWKGSFSRYFFDTGILSAFMSGTTEGSYQLIFQQGAYVGTLLFPRIVFSDGGWPSLPSSDLVMYDGVAFEALGGLGTPGTACFTWTEAVP